MFLTLSSLRSPPCLDSGGGGGGGPGPTKDFGKKRWGKKKEDGPGGDPQRRRQSLRLGTGKKGRAAEISQRRGSLKKRDRTAQKMAKAEAAIERKTVNLPE